MTTHGVIFFRDQHITPPQQVAFTRRFGEIEFNIFGERWSVPGSPEIVVVSNITEDGRPIGVRRAGENWHSDMCYTARPPRGTMLYAIEIPDLYRPHAGRHRIRQRRRRRGRRCPIRSGTGSTGGGRCSTSPAASAPFHRPRRRSIAIRRCGIRSFGRIPHTGRKCLYVMRDDCTGIEGLEPEEAEALIAALADHIVKPAFIYRHQWRAGRPADVGQLHGAAPRHPGLRHAAAAADASHDHGRRGAGVAAVFQQQGVSGRRFVMVRPQVPGQDGCLGDCNTVFDRKSLRAIRQSEHCGDRR